MALARKKKPAKKPRSVRAQVSREEWTARVNLAACYRLFGMRYSKHRTVPSALARQEKALRLDPGVFAASGQVSGQAPGGRYRIDPTRPSASSVSSTVINAVVSNLEIAPPALTAMATIGDQEKATAAGCDGYMAKPFRHQNLYAAIDALLLKSGPEAAIA